MKKILILLSSILCFVSCNKHDCVNNSCICVYKYKNPEYKNLCHVGGSSNFIEYHTVTPIKKHRFIYKNLSIDTTIVKGPEYLIPIDGTAYREKDSLEFVENVRNGFYTAISNNGYVIEYGDYISCGEENKGIGTEETLVITDNIHFSSTTRISSISKKDFIEKKLPYDTIPKTIIDEDPFEEFYFGDTYSFHKTVKDVKEFLDKGGDINELGLTRLKLRK